MLIDKEYPATHSMETSWFCADEDGNVAIFKIEDDGPVPEEVDGDLYISEIFWEIFVYQRGKLYDCLNLSHEQIMEMLNPPKYENVWVHDAYNNYWYDAIIEIDLTKLAIFEQAIASFKPIYSDGRVIRLSPTEGFFHVFFDQDKKIVKKLEENEVVIGVYGSPDFEYYDLLTEKQYPAFLYRQDYGPHKNAAEREYVPQNPLRIEQLPERVRKRISILPLRFADTPNIQMGEYVKLRAISYSAQIHYEHHDWYRLPLTHGGFAFYNMDCHKWMSEEEMDELIASGKAKLIR